VPLAVWPCAQASGPAASAKHPGKMPALAARQASLFAGQDVVEVRAREVGPAGFEVDADAAASEGSWSPSWRCWST
jgi:hypothetical protein